MIRGQKSKEETGQRRSYDDQHIAPMNPCEVVVKDHFLENKGKPVWRVEVKDVITQICVVKLVFWDHVEIRIMWSREEADAWHGPWPQRRVSSSQLSGNWQSAIRWKASWCRTELKLLVETKPPKHNAREHSMHLSSSSDCASTSSGGLWQASNLSCVSMSSCGK